MGDVCIYVMYICYVCRQERGFYKAGGMERDIWAERSG